MSSTLNTPLATVKTPLLNCNMMMINSSTGKQAPAAVVQGIFPQFCRLIQFITNTLWRHHLLSSTIIYSLVTIYNK